MLDRTPSKSTSVNLQMAKTNGHAGRRSHSLIESFIEETNNLDSPEIFRKWTAISAIGATLEQKVWLTTSSPVYPNLYVFLIGHPGTGKTRTINAAKKYLNELPEPHIAPISLTFASLVDCLLRHKRTLILHPNPPMEYNSTWIAADELGTFIHKYDKEMADGLSAFFNPVPYGHERRGNDIKIKIKSPQVNMLCGSTPSNLMETLPDSAWGQGFASRIIMVFSDERIIGDDFEKVTKELSSDLLHDLGVVNSIFGEFEVTAEYRNLINLWRQQHEEPKPNHPRLIHYNSRRKENLYKLSMISAIDKSSVLLLTREDFNRAIGWLHEAEQLMPDIFKAAGGGGMDAKAIDEIFHYVLINDKGAGVSEHKITKFAAERVPIHSVMRVIEIMERGGQIKATHLDPKTKLRMYSAQVPDLDPTEL